MAAPTPNNLATCLIRFGPFEVDFRSAELRKGGARIKLEGQPLQILALLLERPGELVTREELQQKLWPADTYVDFEHSINTAVKRLREALGDSAETPRFVETLPRRGYRFIYPINGAAASAALPAVWWRRHWAASLMSLVTMAALASVLAFNLGGWRNRIFGLKRIERVVVLPFKNLTGDLTQDYLVDGITDLLTTELAQINSLSVISVTSAMHHRDTRKTLPEIASELSVDAAVEGSVQMAGNQLTITVQLVSATDRHLWAKTFEPSAKDVLTLRSQIARNIVREMNAKLTSEDEVRLQRVRTVNPEAQIAYMKGRSVWWRKFNEEALWKSTEFYQTAIEKDPNFAEAYSGVALSYGALHQLHPTEEIRNKSRAAATKALELDPTLAEPHAMLGLRDHNEAECRRALELNPNDALSHLFYAALLTEMRRNEESLAKVRRAEQLDPLSAYISANVVLRLNLLKRYEEAVEQGKKALELDPDFWLTYMWMGGSYWHLKRYDQAIPAWEKVVGLQSGYETWALSRLIAAYMKVGRKDDARKAFARVLDIAAKRYVEPNRLALAYAAIGKKGEAIAMLQKAQRQGEELGTSSPELKELLGDDARYQQLLRNAGVPPSRKRNSK